MSSRTYVAKRPGAFGGLVQASDLAGYRLEPLAPVNIRDFYFDTSDGELLRQGMCLRVREQDGERRALLRPIRPDASGIETEAALDGPQTEVFSTPKGLLHDALESLVGGNAPGQVDLLYPLLRLRQYRTPRMVYDGSRLLALLSFDVVVVELPDGPHASNELDIELSEEGHEADLYTIDPILRRSGLVPVALTKFERGITRLPRTLTEPLLLLPDERTALEVFAESNNTLYRRRARVLLLDARGFRSSTIAQQVELSTARVRHWKQQFREQRMSVFDMEARSPAQNQHAYRVSEVVATAGQEPLATTASQTPPPAGPPPAPPEPLSIHEPPVAGDGSSEELPRKDEPEDIDDLLAMFRPGDTTTPILSGEPDLTPDLPLPSDDEELLSLEDEVQRGPESYLDQNQPDADLPPVPETLDEHEASGDASLSPGEILLPEGPSDVDLLSSPTSVEASASPEASGGKQRRPRIRLDDPLLGAALRILSYHFGQLGWCAADLDRKNGPFRLLLAVHRVRLSLEVFAPILPRETVESLHRGLRRLGFSLNDSLDLNRKSVLTPDNADLVRRRERAVDTLRSILEGHSFETWIGRAQRLVERLASQQRAGTDVPDDAPPVWDDYVADPGVIPSRTRVRHLLGGALWERVEALLSWEQDGHPPEADHAYHLALACSGIRFVLGIAEAAAPTHVRRADSILDRAESRLMALHHSGTGAPVLNRSAEIADIWGELRGADLRASLGATLQAL